MRNKIIFDNDGVNIDSEDIAMRIMNDWGRAFVLRYRPDAPLPEEEIYNKYVGTSADKIFAALIEQFDLPLERIAKDYEIKGETTAETICTALGDIITNETCDRFRHDLKSIPGATQSLSKIRSLFGAENMALATTSRSDRMDICLAHAIDPLTGENARLEEMFPAGSRRRSGYGQPNKYDEAFAALGWNPAHTIIVEDSRSGVRKAKTGRPDVAVIGTVAAKFYTDKEAQAGALLEEGANLVISTLADIPLAAEWLKGDMAQPRPPFSGTVYTHPVKSHGTEQRFHLRATR